MIILSFKLQMVFCSCSVCETTWCGWSIDLLTALLCTQLWIQCSNSFKNVSITRTLDSLVVQLKPRFDGRDGALRQRFKLKCVSMRPKSVIISLCIIIFKLWHLWQSINHGRFWSMLASDHRTLHLIMHVYIAGDQQWKELRGDCD